VLFPIITILIILPGCASESTPPTISKQQLPAAISSDRLKEAPPRAVAAVSDTILIEQAKKAFTGITRAEERALTVEADPEAKKVILFETLRQMATESLIAAYEKAWAEGTLGITLTIEKISQGKVVERSATRAVVLVKVDGTVNDESGSEPASDFYRLTMTKQGNRWLLSGIEVTGG